MKSQSQPTDYLNPTSAAADSRPTTGEKPLKIRNIRTFVTAPEGCNLIVVKVETDEPDLFGLGCATFCYRHHAVRALVDGHLKPLLIGRDARQIEDLHQLMRLNAYWRNGPVINNAISGIDMALWDIKAREAGMPLYQLLGGRCRVGATVYRHADGRDPAELKDNVRKFIDEGVTHIRIQSQGYGGSKSAVPPGPGFPPGHYYDPAVYRRSALAALETVRETFGDEIHLLHDVHERLSPAEAVRFAREVEPFRLFFLEDLLSPEDRDWFANVRATSTTPLAMGELFTNPLEWTPLVINRQINYLRMHISDIGGLTPARKAAVLGETFGVRTAWHGPPDQSPIGHAVALHLDLVAPNFGIQEFCGFGANTREVFPGCPQLYRGVLYASDLPGIGVGFDETAAARFPEVDAVTDWTQARLPDGTLNPP
ncbi:MAG: enolase C-terminal domain-like protein [Opitutaceae bacterium]